MFGHHHQSSATTASTSKLNDSNAVAAEETNNINQEALEAARRVGAHAYKLEGLKPGEKLCYIEIGCSGDGGAKQQEVADLIAKKEKAFKDTGKKIHFKLLLGDIIYKHGARSPQDIRIAERITQKYTGPVFGVPGNHDAGICITSSRMDKNPREVILNLVAATYVPDAQFPTVADKCNVFEAPKIKDVPTDDDFINIDLGKKYEVQRKTININQLPQFNMPNTFYSLHTDLEEIFVVDSNTLAEDFINWIEWNNNNKVVSLNPNNQIPFLIEEYKNAIENNRETSFKMHQLPKTTGERSHHFDTGNYLYPVQIQHLKEILKTDCDSHNQLIGLIFQHLNISVKNASGAHDHYLELRQEKDYFQIVSGGGGSKEKQQLCNNQSHPDIKLSISKHGFVINHGNEVQLYTTDGWEIAYDRNKKDFIYDDTIPISTKILRNCILQACENYIDELKQTELKKKEYEKNAETLEKNCTENTTAYSSLYSNVTLFLGSTVQAGMKVGKKALKTFTPYNFDLNKEQEIASVYELRAYFNQHTLDPKKIEIDLTKWKTRFSNQSFYAKLRKFLKNNLNSQEFKDILNIFTSKSLNESNESNQNPSSSSTVSTLNYSPT